MPRFVAATLAFLSLVSAAAFGGNVHHVLIVSIDGLHQADLQDPAVNQYLPTLMALSASGISYTHACTTTPSDSFPGTMAYLTGATPKTTGIYYDDVYFRDLVGPGGAAGLKLAMTEAMDADETLIHTQLDPHKLPHLVAEPGKAAQLGQLLKVNTIFEVAHDAGLRTAYMDKHPVYVIANGPSGKGLDEFYGPEIEARAVLVDGHLLDAGDAAAAGHKLTKIAKDVSLAAAYDRLKVDALLHQIAGDDVSGRSHPGVPNLFGMNLQAVNVGEKMPAGGIDLVDGSEVVSPALIAGLKSVDESLERITQALDKQRLSDDTLLIITAKHGQNPRVGPGTCAGANAITKPLKDAGIKVVSVTEDDVSLVFLADPADAGKAAGVLTAGALTRGAGGGNSSIDKVLWGASLKAAGLFGDADRSPDLVVTLKPAALLIDKLTKRAEHGGFSPDETQVPLILCLGGVDVNQRRTEIADPVQTKQIAVTALQALGLDARELRGAVTEGTRALPAGK